MGVKKGSDVNLIYTLNRFVWVVIDALGNVCGANKLENNDLHHEYKNFGINTELTL